MKASTILFILVLPLAGCASVVRDDTMAVQKAVDAAGTVTFPAGTYLLTRTIVVRNSNTVIQGTGPETVFIFLPNTPRVHCGNDRAFTTPCDVLLTPRRQIVAPISIGDNFFTAAADASDLSFGDWLLIEEMDKKAGDIIAVDWMQVASASGNVVTTQNAFRVAFPDARAWDPANSGLGFYKFPNKTENVQFRNFSIIVPDSGQISPGISVFAARHTLIENVTVHDPHGQPLYSYISKDLTIQNSFGYGEQILNEFGATVDLTLTGNTFSSVTDAALGVDFGSGFFRVTGNSLPSSANIGAYFYDGVHDGEADNNNLLFVNNTSESNFGNSVGILARGTHHVNIINNFLAGGAGTASVGLTIGPEYSADVTIPSFANIITPNRFGPNWGVDYDPSNVP
jgi:hypothetical protein